MSAPVAIHRTQLRGLSGDNLDRKRMVVSFDLPDGSVTRLSVSIDDLETLGGMVDHAKPLLTKAWRKRDEAQR